MASEKTSLTALEISNATMEQRLRDVSLRLPSGTLAALVGPNGAGKSTLLQIAAGLIPSGGRCEWGGRPLGSVPVLERGRCAAWVPQEARFEFGFSVRSVVAQGRFAHGDDERGVDAILARLDLAALADRPVTQLSGGERQRVLLARALATEAPLQLWDEPLAPLDPRHVLEVLHIARSHADSGGTLLLSLHDLRVAFCMDVVVVLNNGRLQAVGKPAEVLTPSLLLNVFGVQSETAESLILKLP